VQPSLFDNRYQASTSASKLRGQYYTPPELVRLILEGLRPAHGDVIVDPACGDGSFLCGAVAALARHGGSFTPDLVNRVIGFDIDPETVALARRNVRSAFREHFGVEVSVEAIQVHPVDALARPELSTILKWVGLPPPGPGERLLVVGNPPYVEAKRLGRETKAELKRRYPEAISGAPDLYLYFLYVCLGWLREGDRLALVLPNKLLVNGNAQQLRGRLLAEHRLRGLWLATQAKIFEDASVYPVVLFAGGPAEIVTVPVQRIERDPEGRLQAGAPIEVRPELFRQTQARAFFPPPEDPVLGGALERLLAPDVPRLDAVLDLRWSISFHRAGLREQYVTRERPESALAQRFLGGGAFSGNGEVRRYGLAWAGWWIDYDAARLQREGNPVPDLQLFRRPKIVLCQNGRTLRAAFDEAGFVLKDTFLCGLPRGGDHPLCEHPRALVGLLCSRAAHFFYSHVFFGGHVNGGYLHFLRSFLVDLPIGEWTPETARRAASLVALRERTRNADEAARLEQELEAAVSRALGLEEAEVGGIQRWSLADPNWGARERIRLPAVSARESPAGAGAAIG
jgi:predicted RNA methylase